MRLDGTPIPTSELAEELQAATQVSQGPGLWGPFFGALWLNASLLAAIIYFPRYGLGALAPLAAWIVGLGVIAWLTCRSRIELHDMLVDLGERERLFLGLLILMFLLLPVFSRHCRIIPDGFLWTMPAMMLISVKPHLARRLLAWTLIGGWFAALYIHDPLSLGLLLAFAVSWLLALGATHFAFTGDPYGLTGWWPFRKVLANALLTSIPATLVGVMIWWFLPKEAVRALRQAGADHPATGLTAHRLADRLSTVDLMVLLWEGAACLVLTAILFIFLLYIRRLILKRRRTSLSEDILLGQVARLEYRVTPPPHTPPSLSGRRGKIVKLWGQWAAAMEREGLGRQSGETAAQFAGRLSRQTPDAAPPAALTGLFEQAHYGPAEPTPADLEAMRQYVQTELSKLSLTGQKPMEPLDPQD